MVSLIQLETTYEVVDLVRFILDLDLEQETRLLSLVALLKEGEGIILFKQNKKVRFASLEEYHNAKVRLNKTISILKGLESYSVLMTK